MSGEPKHMVAFIQGQPETTCHRGEHLLRGLRSAPLLKTLVIVGGHIRQTRNIFASQAPGAAPRPTRKTHDSGLYVVSSTPKKICQSASVHLRIVYFPSTPNHRSPIRGLSVQPETTEHNLDQAESSPSNAAGHQTPAGGNCGGHHVTG